MNLVTPNVIARFDEVLSRGLCVGVGERDGQMCIEAAICYALDLPHGDDPDCVTESVRKYKICLNDTKWSSPGARAKGLRDLGIAQIGSKGVISDVEFSKRLQKKTIHVLIPKLFREIFTDLTRNDHLKCLETAKKCEELSTAAEAAAAARAAEAAWAAAVVGAAAEAAAWAAEAAWATEAARAVEVVGAAAWAAARAARAAEAAARAAGAAARAAGAVDAVWAAGADEYLRLSASLALEVLRELKSPGVAYLDSGEDYYN